MTDKILENKQRMDLLFKVTESVNNVIELNNEELDKNNFIYHAGTSENNNKIYAVGGRVLNFISLSNTFSEAKKNIHENLEKLNWEKGFFRKDIGYKVIDK